MKWKKSRNLLTFFTQRSKNLVSRKAWPHPPIIGGRSSSSSGGNAQNGLSSPVSCPALGSGAPVTPILGISDVSSTGWVRFPSTILTTYRIDVGSNGTFEITRLSQIAFWAISGNSWAQPGNLFLYTRIMFNTSGNVSPGSIFLKRYKKGKKCNKILVILGSKCGHFSLLLFANPPELLMSKIPLKSHTL